jgi:hypothetical protein
MEVRQEQSLQTDGMLIGNIDRTLVCMKKHFFTLTVHMKDDIEAGNFPYRGQLQFQSNPLPEFISKKQDDSLLAPVSMQCNSIVNG